MALTFMLSSAFYDGVDLYDVERFGAQYIHLRYGLIHPSLWLYLICRLLKYKVQFYADG